ncbi:Tetraspanin family-domain-containing protein [Sporodiniella umbellata]|nr:Tetraspanin family-domain-containing protein [Sporodiniella umbellata]
MATCCARLSKLYMIVTNSLFACLGLAFLAFGLIGIRTGFHGSDVFPINTFRWLAILGAIVCVASLLGLVGAFVRKHWLTSIYMLIILAALVLQVLVGIKLYRACANVPTYLSDLWTSATPALRNQLQKDFTCCGFQTNMDKFVKNEQCDPRAKMLESLGPCADPLISFSKNVFGKAYLVIFVALALELLAMSNAITLLCVRSDPAREEDSERRRRRKSGIKLDDISLETPTTLVGSSYTLSEEQKKHYQTYDQRQNAYY